jgi:hypothetical protein
MMEIAAIAGGIAYAAGFAFTWLITYFATSWAYGDAGSEKSPVVTATGLSLAWPAYWAFVLRMLLSKCVRLGASPHDPRVIKTISTEDEDEEGG